jgi:hypothetical protein
MKTKPSLTLQECEGLIISALKAAPKGGEFCASQVRKMTIPPIPKHFVGRALTKDRKNPIPPNGANAIPEVRMRRYRKLDGGLTGSAWWYSLADE